MSLTWPQTLDRTPSRKTGRRRRWALAGAFTFAVHSVIFMAIVQPDGPQDFHDIQPIIVTLEWAQSPSNDTRPSDMPVRAASRRQTLNAPQPSPLEATIPTEALKVTPPPAPAPASPAEGPAATAPAGPPTAPPQARITARAGPNLSTPFYPAQPLWLDCTGKDPQKMTASERKRCTPQAVQSARAARQGQYVGPALRPGEQARFDRDAAIAAQNAPSARPVGKYDCPTANINGCRTDNAASIVIIGGKF